MKKARHYRGGYQSSGLGRFAQQLRKEPTDVESLLWEHLRDRRLLGFKFRRQHQFGDYIADFYCREANLVIECDGQIHARNESWHHDRLRDAYMSSQGLRVLRFTNEQVRRDTEVVLSKIGKHLRGG